MLAWSLKFNIVIYVYSACMKYNIIIMMVIVILCYPLLLAKVKEYAVTIAIHNCNCHCCYLGLSCKGALGTNATKCSHRLNCYWLGWRSRRYLYIDNAMQLSLSCFLPCTACPTFYRGATVSGLHGVVLYVSQTMQIYSHSHKSQLWSWCVFHRWHMLTTWPITAAGSR